MTKYCSHGTLLHFGLQNSHLNNCYYHQDLHWEQFHLDLRHSFCTTPTPSYSSKLQICSDGRVSAPQCSAIHFQGWFIRQVSFKTLLSGFLLSGTPSCCLNEPTPFMVSDYCGFRRLNSTLGASLIASSAYQKWPTKHIAFFPRVQIRKPLVLTNLKFENRTRKRIPRDL